MSYKIGIVGTGLVGCEALHILHETSFPYEEIMFFSQKGDRDLFEDAYGNFPIYPLSMLGQVKCDFILGCHTDKIAERYLYPEKEDSIIVDNSSAYRMNLDVPLLVPTIHSRFKFSKNQHYIASPNCVATQLSITVFPFLAMGLQAIEIETSQSYSGKGAEGLEDFFRQQADQSLPETLPQLSKEEEKIRNELPKILNNSSLSIKARCYRGNHAYGHEIKTTLSFEKMTAADMKKILGDDPFKNIALIKQHSELSAIKDTIRGKNEIFVGDLSWEDNKLQFSSLADNLRIGAALNLVHILQQIISEK